MGRCCVQFGMGLLESARMDAAAVRDIARRYDDTFVKMAMEGKL